MALETIPFDISEFLESDEAVVVYLDEALASGDPAYFAHGLGKVVATRGISKIARDSGLSRASLHAALSEGGSPALATMMQVMKSLGLRLGAEPVDRAPLIS